MKIIIEDGLPVKMWLKEIEDGAMEQALNLAKLPFAFHHIAIMPDAHQGYGMPIGGVLATKGVIIPNAVGVDIGCGVCAIKTSVHIDNLPVEKIKEIIGEIRKVVPVGFKHRQFSVDDAAMPQVEFANLPIISQEYQAAKKQIGTLGGGNHFIELQKGSDGFVWVMVHSGSRNLGKKVADHYNDIAKNLNQQFHSEVPEKADLAFLPIGSLEGQLYYKEMQYCVTFAQASRKLMMDAILKCMVEVLNVEAFDLASLINVPHNYAALENHFGVNVMVHRKGATQAKFGQIGLIPGSQGTKSYVVQGYGNVESFHSCSHGAGRKLSRTKAQNELKLEDEIKLLDDQGVVHGMRNKNDLDEAPSAYKDILEVMKNQSDLVSILVELQPIAVIKA